MITWIKQLLCIHDWREHNYCIKCKYDRSYKMFLKEVKRTEKLINGISDLPRWE